MMENNKFNISNKTGLGNYTYESGKPHAVNEVENASGLIIQADINFLSDFKE